jgi:hypothetical protein
VLKGSPVDTRSLTSFTTLQEILFMALARHSHKVDRVRITFVPTGDKQGFTNIPSTFSPSSRTYGWRKDHHTEYLIVPQKISSNEIVVEMFIASRKFKTAPSELHKVVQEIVQSKISSEWQGLKLAGISRAASAVPPDKRYVRGTIEEILGARLER